MIPNVGGIIYGWIIQPLIQSITMATANHVSTENTVTDPVLCSRTHLPRHAMAIRLFVIGAMLCIAIDATPRVFKSQSLRSIKVRVNTTLRYLGLSQGDWPLFAPNPSVDNPRIVAEVLDGENQKGTWSSPEWSRSSIWEKFYRFRHMNYYQRVGRNVQASSDLADYLHRSIPDRETIIPSIRFDADYELLPPAEFVPPIRAIKVYEYKRRLLLNDGEPLPNQAETNWTNHSQLAAQRKYHP
ncbi:MAG: hypothetical protein WCI02_07785 [Planctomycetota bacterium]